MYSIADYGAMIRDSARLDAFVRALRRVVTPQTVVADIGTGTGILALLACQAGARRVYAIEPDAAIHLAREAAAANGYADRMACVEGLSTAITLPERADVIVSDIGGLLPFLQHHLPALVDARARFLAPGGTLIPCRDTLWLALVEAPELYRRHAEPWDAYPYGLDLTSGRRLALNTWRPGLIVREQLLAAPARGVSVDYTVVTNPNVDMTVEFTVARTGSAHGFAVGIDRVLVDDIGFSNAPDCADPLPSNSIYRTGFFPWVSPVPVAAGDVVTVSLRAVLVGDDYVWSWKSRVVDQGPAGHVKARFDQSTFYGMPLSAAQVHKRSARHVPTLNEEGTCVRLALDLMGRAMPLGEIARQLQALAPARFRDWKHALAYVADLAQRYA